MTHRVRCPKCQRVYPGTEKFCGTDGTQLVEIESTPAAFADPLIGQLLDGRYRVERPLGAGGMGLVYLAQHVDTQKTYAIKVMRDDMLTDDAAFRRFESEARALSSIDHPHIVEVYDFGQTENGVPFLVMEYLQGTTLRQCLTDLPGSGLPLNQAVNIIMQTAEAMRYVHQAGIIHRDIKPDNIQLTVNNERTVFVKVFDFGIARVQQEIGVTSTQKPPPSTLAYAAPEMHISADYLNPAIDVYALGVTLFETITKERPFAGTGIEVVWSHMKATPRKLGQLRTDVKIPAQLEELTEQMLMKEPSKRPTMAEVADRLAALSSNIHAQPVRGLHNLRTFVLPKEPRDAAAKKSASRPGARREVQTALQLFSASRDIDQIETEREHLSAQMQVECEEIIKRSFTKGMSPELAGLVQRCEAIEKAKGDLELDLALLKDTLAQEKAESQARRNQLRQKIQTQRDALRGVTDAADPQRQIHSQELARLERAYAAIDPPSATIARFQQEGTRQQQLRSELLDAQRELGEQLLRDITESAKQSVIKGAGGMDRKLDLIIRRLTERLSHLVALDEMLEQA